MRLVVVVLLLNTQPKQLFVSMSVVPTFVEYFQSVRFKVMVKVRVRVKIKVRVKANVRTRVRI